MSDSGRNNDLGDETHYESRFLAQQLGLEPDELNDAIEELDSERFVKTFCYLGTHPFEYAAIEPTFALFRFLGSERLGYDPDDDIKSIASLVSAKRQIDGPGLYADTGIPPLRINRAVGFIRSYELATIHCALGTSPYGFSYIVANAATRRFVNERCR